MQTQCMCIGIFCNKRGHSLPPEVSAEEEIEWFVWVTVTVGQKYNILLKNS